MTNLILCGGWGSRLWPLSRKNLPKQFVRLFDNLSLFEKTFFRNRKICKDIFLLGNKENFYQAKNQLQKLRIKKFKYIIEPLGRNTAPAIILACLSLNENEIVLVTPTDHLIKNEKAYLKAINKGIKKAENGFIVTFGVKASYPEKSYGYILIENEQVKKFKEKPSLQLAKKLIKKGALWNSGILCFKAGVLINEVKKCTPEIFKTTLKAFKKYCQTGELTFADMSKIPALSIDKALLEKTANLTCIPFANSLVWSDLGNFDALADFYQRGLNYSLKNKTIFLDSKNNFVVSSGRKVCLIDIEDLILADTQDALLVLKRGSSQKVKKLYAELTKQSSKLIEYFPQIERSWGNYLLIAEGSSYIVRKIEISPQQRFSWQNHHYGTKQWTIVQGKALIYLNNSQQILKAGETICIPSQTTHCLKNLGKGTLILIEIQFGSKLRETNKKIEDDYH